VHERGGKKGGKQSGNKKGTIRKKVELNCDLKSSAYLKKGVSKENESRTSEKRERKV